MKPSSHLLSAILVLIVAAACAGQPGAETRPAALATATGATVAVTAVASAATPVAVPTSTARSATHTASRNTGCVSAYDPERDYFPDKLSLSDAVGWTIEYFNNYKLITVLTPWSGAEAPVRYVLVQCGTPPPVNIGDAQVIEVPVRTVVMMSTTQLPHLSELGLLDHLVGVDNVQYISTPAVIEKIAAGEVVAIGGGATVNVERAIDLQPDLIMTYGVGDPQHDAHPKLIEAGLKVALNSEYMETSPLGRAEWIKFTAAFFNQEAAATSVYDQIARRYNTIAAQAATVRDKPTVFTGTPYQGTWSVPGGQSYVARLLADAGASYLWADDSTTGSQQVSFEAVFERAQNADFWLNPGGWTSLADGLAEDERFAEFVAFQRGNVFNNNLRLNANGGNDFFERGVTNPDVVLADLITIFHPDLLPDHELYYYQRLDS